MAYSTSIIPDSPKPLYINKLTSHKQAHFEIQAYSQSYIKKRLSSPSQIKFASNLKKNPSSVSNTKEN